MITLPASEANPGSIRDVERASIQQFLQAQGEYIRGRVLDFGCGRQPYRSLVESFGAEYHGYDRAANPGSVTQGEDIGDDYLLEQTWDVVLTTQTIQYQRLSPHRDDPMREEWSPLLDFMWQITWMCGAHQEDEGRANHHGVLIMTYPVAWDIVEKDDYFRPTPSGVEDLLKAEGMQVLVHERRAEVDCNGFKFPLGYGVVARA